MPEIIPFKAVIYSRENLKNPSSLFCPPYDVISSQEQQHYHDLSPYNFIRILLGKNVPQENKYRRAASLFKEWLKKGVFIQEEEPALYFYRQQYSIRGESKSRIGFIALLRIKEEDSSVFAHENTKSAAKHDRARLLRAVKANLSPIFAAFTDKDRIISRIYQQHIEGKEPFIEARDGDNVTHQLWKLDSPELIAKVQASLKDKNIFIADGHHRYEVACAFRQEMSKKLSAPSGEEGFNYVMAYFTDSQSQGLTILPVHRLVKAGAKFNIEDFKSSLRQYFRLEEVKDKSRFFFLMEKGGRTENVLGMYIEKKFWLLRLKNIKILDKMITGKPKEYRLLDVAILNSIILNRMLGLSLEDNDNILYGPGAQQFIEKADEIKGSIAFFLNPLKMQQVASLALSGSRMPPKSTYFYPKLLSGMVINKLNDGKS